MFPNQANAQEANMSTSEYKYFVYGAGYIESKDPIAEWKEIEKKLEQQIVFRVANVKMYVLIALLILFRLIIFYYIV